MREAGTRSWTVCALVAGMLGVVSLAVRADEHSSQEAPATQLATAPQLRAVDYAEALDPQTSLERKAALVEVLRGEARRKDRLALYVLGSAYRLGDRHPAKLLPKDLDKARAYLSNASALGMVDAMAGVAEVELMRHDPTSAMVWAQLYGHYKIRDKQAQAARGAESQENLERGYVAGLLHRCRVALGSNYDDAAILRDANAFAARFGEQVQENRYLPAFADAENGPKPLRSISPYWVWDALKMQQRFHRSTDPELGGKLMLLVGVAANGAPERALVLDSLPDENLGNEFLGAGSVLPKFSNGGAKSGDLNWTLLTYEVVDQRYKLH